MTKSRDYSKAIGIVWLRQEDFEAARAIFEDADKMPKTWAEWEEIATRAERQYQAEGRIPERIYLDPGTFPDWCAREGVGVNSMARMRFAAMAVRRKYGVG